MKTEYYTDGSEIFKIEGDGGSVLMQDKQTGQAWWRPCTRGCKKGNN